MPIKFEKPKKVRDLATAAQSATGFIIKAALSNPLAVIDAWKTISALKTQDTDSIENRAWVWAFGTLSLATKDILFQTRIDGPLAAKYEEAVSEFLVEALNLEDAEFTPSTLRSPLDSRAFKPALKALPKLLLDGATAQELKLETLDIRFRKALNEASYRTFCANPTYFKPLEDALRSESGELARREADWAKHHHWIISQFTDRPIFSKDGKETIPISAMYQWPRCFWNEEEEIESKDIRPHSRDIETRRTASIDLLSDVAQKWLSIDARQEPIRIVTGGPGSGKSSFAAAFAKKVILQESHRVAFVQLQRMRLTGDLRNDVSNYFETWNGNSEEVGNRGLPGDPLDWRKGDSIPLLLIFDGLDELTANDEEAKTLSREFVLKLDRLLRSLNIDDPPIRALVLGRNAACEDALDAASMELKVMLNIASLIPMTRKSCLLPEYFFDLNDFKDPKDLGRKSQLTDYWNKWANLKGLDAKSPPKFLSEDGFVELCSEPLLLNLLLNSRFAGDDWEIAAENPNLVYEDILKENFRRNKKEGRTGSADLEERDYFDLLECLGLAAFKGNGRIGTNFDFVKTRAIHLDSEGKFEGKTITDLDSVAINIHTRKGTQGLGYEFIHRTFGEYLIARGLTSHCWRIAKTYLDSNRPERVLEEWVSLVGTGTLTSTSFEFLRREAKYVGSNDLEDTIDRAAGLTKLFNWALIHGYPIPKENSNLSFRTLETRQQCAEVALLAVLSGLAQSIPMPDVNSDQRSKPVHLVNLKLDGTKASEMMHRIGATLGKLSNECLSRLNFQGANLANINLPYSAAVEASFVGANLSGTNLNGANLSGSNLRKADLTGANLNDAGLFHANLNKTKLNAADLQETYLIEANLAEAKLDNANLTKAHMHSAQLSNASLKNARICKANLSQANLTAAQLQGADLSDVDLRGADLQKANLDDANLSNSEMLGTKLNEALIRKVCFRNARMHSVDLRHSILRHSDLCDVDLRGTDLRGADFSDADLSYAYLLHTKADGAIFVRTNLSGAHLTSVSLACANLRNACLVGAHLDDADLRGANLGEADLASASLESCDLRSVDLTRVKNLSIEAIRSAIYSADTKLPDYIDRSQL